MTRVRATNQRVDNADDLHKVFIVPAGSLGTLIGEGTFHWLVRWDKAYVLWFDDNQQPHLECHDWEEHVTPAHVEKLKG